MVTIINGKWWFGGERKNELALDKVVVDSFDRIKNLFNIKEGAIFQTSNGFTLKKEAGAWNFYIKTKNNKWKKIKTKTLNKIFSGNGLTRFLTNLVERYNNEENQAEAWIEEYRPYIAKKYNLSEKEVERVYQPYFFTAWDM